MKVLSCCQSNSVLNSVASLVNAGFSGVTVFHCIESVAPFAGVAARCLRVATTASLNLAQSEIGLPDTVVLLLREREPTLDSTVSSSIFHTGSAATPRSSDGVSVVLGCAHNSPLLPADSENDDGFHWTATC